MMLYLKFGRESDLERADGSYVGYQLFMWSEMDMEVERNILLAHGARDLYHTMRLYDYLERWIAHYDRYVVRFNS